MALSDNLVEQFAELAKIEKVDEGKVLNSTYRVINGKEYVQLDGSDVLTPVNSVVEAEDGERVKTEIKNHVATVINNISSPSARTKSVQDLKDEVDDQGNKIQMLDTTVTAQGSSITTINSHLQTVDSQIVAANTQISAHDTTLGLHQTAIEANSSAISVNSSNISSLSDTVTSVGNTVTAQGNRITANENNITAINSDIIDINSSISNIGTQITTANSQISILNSGFKIEDGVLTGLSTIVVDDLETNHLDATYAEIDFANINQAAVTKIFSDSGIIKDLVVQSGNITGELVGVTLKGDLVEANTLKADRLVVRGNDGLYYKLNIDGIDGISTSQATKFTLLSSEPANWDTNYKDYYKIVNNEYVHVTGDSAPTFQTNTYYKLSSTYESGLDGTVIVAHSITADKVQVSDLVAFGATIGGLHIDQNSIYSGVKSSVSNTTSGIYLDSSGQMNIGNNTNFIKYFNDNGTWKLLVNADTIRFGTNNQSIETVIGDISSDISDMQTDIEKTVKQVDVEYYLSDSSSTTTGGSWSTTAPTWVDGKYMWSRQKVTYVDDTTATRNATCIAGATGATGAQGPQGNPGQNGTSSYTHIRYSENSDGTGFVTTPTAATIYIGVYTGTSSTAPTNKTSYTWSKYKGDKGETGDTGNGINSITYYYKTTTTSTQPSASEITSTTLPTLTSTNKYLWQKEVIDFTDSSIQDKTTVSLLAVYGDTGSQGPQGNPGQNGASITITSKSIKYQASSSGTTIPTGTWQDNVPTVNKGSYLWTRTIVNYSDNTNTTSYSVAYAGTDGQQGDDGVGVASIQTQFYLSTSKESPTGGSWTTTSPTWSTGKYIWTRSHITYTNNTTADTEPMCDSSWEAVDDLEDKLNGDGTVSGEGTSFTLNNTLNGGTMSIRLNGDTKQTSYDGRNKLNYDLSTIKAANASGTWNNNIYTWNGVTFTVNNDLTITTGGTFSDRAYLYLENVQQAVEKTSYILNGCPSGGSSSTYKMNIDMYENGTWNAGYNDTGNSVTANFSSYTTPTAKVYIDIRGSGGIGKTFKPMLRLATETNANYEQYCGGTTSPNPSFPQQIEVVSKDNTIKVIGRQLLQNTNEGASHWINSTGNGTSSIAEQDFDGIKGLRWTKTAESTNWQVLMFWDEDFKKFLYNKPQGTKFKISFDMRVNADSNKQVAIHFCNSSGSYSLVEGTATGGSFTANVWKHCAHTWTRNSTTILSDQVVYLSTFQLQKDVSQIDIKNLKVELGETDTPWEEYRNNTFKISLGSSNEFDKNNINLIDGYYVDSSAKIVAGSNNKFNWVKLTPSKNYFLYQPKKSNVTVRVALFSSQPVADATGTIIGTYTGTNEISLGFSTTSTNYYLGWVYCNTANLNGYTYQEMVDSVLLFRGTELIDYSDNPIELCEFEDYRDYFYRDNNFKWFLHKEVAKLIFNGSEADWAAFSVNYEYQIPYTTKAASDTEGQFFLNNLSSHFVATSKTSTQMPNNSFSHFSSIGYRWFRFRYNEKTSLADFKNWLANNNVIVYYQLKNPNIIEITKENYPVLYEQLYNLDKAVTYIDQTNFFVEGDLPIKLDITAFQNNITGKVASQNLLLSDVNSSYTPISSFTEFSSSQEITNQNIMQTVSRTTTTLYGENDDNTGLVQSVNTNTSKIEQNEGNISLIFEDTHQLADRTGTLETNTADIINQFVFGDDGLTISNKGSTSQDMRLNLTNDQIQFLYQNNVVLKINGSTIEFSNASFEKLDLGHYVWQAEGDDSLSLIYES